MFGCRVTTAAKQERSSPFKNSLKTIFETPVNANIDGRPKERRKIHAKVARQRFVDEAQLVAAGAVPLTNGLKIRLDPLRFHDEV